MKGKSGTTGLKNSPTGGTDYSTGDPVKTTGDQKTSKKTRRIVTGEGGSNRDSRT